MNTLEILPEVIENLIRQYPVMGVAYHGSTLHGCTRPDSDLDLIIFNWLRKNYDLS